MTGSLEARAPGRARLTLLPGLRRLWRDEFTVQLGVDPGRAVVIDLPDPTVARVLDLLDGSHTERGVLREAVRLGVAAHDASDLLTALRRAGLVWETDRLMPAALPEPARRRLVTEVAAIAMDARCGGDTHGSPRHGPAESIRRRAAASVQVIGAARLGTPIAAALARAGVGRVDPVVSGRVTNWDDALGGLLPADTDRPRGTTAVEAVLRAAPFADARPIRGGRATFAVLIGLGMPARLIAAAHARRRLPHLLIEQRDDVLLIGPLVPDAGSPCLACLDLHRQDRDPAWPALIAQLATAGEDTPTISIATTLVGVGIAVGQVLAHLDGRPTATTGASIEVGPSASLHRRSWPAHPRCDCSREPLARPPRRRPHRVE